MSDPINNGSEVFELPEAVKTDTIYAGATSAEDALVRGATAYKNLQKSYTEKNQSQIHLPDSDEPEKIQAFYNKLRPADKAEYGLDDAELADLAHSNGLTKHQAKGIADVFKSLKAKSAEVADIDDATLASSITQSFGDKKDEVISIGSALIDQIYGDKAEEIKKGMTNKESLQFLNMASVFAQKFGVKQSDFLPQKPAATSPNQQPGNLDDKISKARTDWNENYKGKLPDWNTKKAFLTKHGLEEHMSPLFN